MSYFEMSPCGTFAILDGDIKVYSKEHARILARIARTADKFRGDDEYVGVLQSILRSTLPEYMTDEDRNETRLELSVLGLENLLASAAGVN